MNREASRIILFDGVCNLCNGAVQFVIRRDPAGKFRFASLQSEPAQVLLRQHNLPADFTDSFLYLRDGRCFSRSSAALEVARDLGGWWKIAYAGKIIPRPIRDFVYNIIARNRYRLFGKRQACMRPTPDLQARFLS
jgi:predicted DCC family thiol-disulfide oxidoreductase YuxK